MKALDEIFEGLVSVDSPGEYILGHPVLLSAAWQKALLATVSTERQKETLAKLVNFTSGVQQNPSEYPLGLGPIERLSRQVGLGEVTKSRSLELAAQPSIHLLLSPFYVRLLSFYAQRRARENDWETGVGLQQLILAALDARRGQVEIDQEEMDFIAVVHWLDIVTRAVWDIPDGNLFRDACKRGEDLAPTIDDPGAFYPPAEILHRLGILHLDPYVGGRTNADYESQWRLWQDRFDQDRSRSIENTAIKDERIPRAEEALPKAANYLRRASPHRAATHRGLTLKALLQALVWHRAVGLTPDGDEVRAVAAEALILLPAPGYDEQRTEIENLLRWNATESGEARLGDATAVENARNILKQSIDHWLSERDPQQVILLFMQSASSVIVADPRLALDLWLAVAPLVPDQEEQLRSTYYHNGLGLVSLALAPEELPAEGQPLVARATAVEALGRESYTTAAMLFALAVRSGATNEEDAGAQMLDRVPQISAQFAERFRGLLLFTKALLQHNGAVSAKEQGKLGEAVRLYMLSAGSLLSNCEPHKAFDALEKALDLTVDGDVEAINWAVVFVGDIATKIEQQLGDRVAYRLQVAYRGLLARISKSGRVNPVLVVLFWQAAKGNAFSHALGSGTPLPWLDTTEARRMEERIEGLARQAAPEPRPLLDESLLLTGYVSSQEQQGGDKAGEQLRNLQISFDAEVNRQLLSREAPSETGDLTDEALQATLGPSTVLLSPYIGSTLTGDLAVFTLWLTREDMGLTMGHTGLPSGAVVFGAEQDGGLTSSLFGPLVEQVRESIQEEPGPRSASGTALSLLQKGAKDLFGGGLEEKLAALRKAGKDHLCICPHGPYHFYPYHLIGPEDHPLAAEWSVTYLPNLRLLDPARRVTQPREPFIAIGLDFPESNSRGLPALSGPEAEAIEIAALTHAPSLTGTAVTESSVVDAFTCYRRIHLGTHGDLNVSAPSFQCLYLSPAAGGDVLNAYEILRLDLSGVDLVTLSACETALGRIDLGDNPRGIPASLLLAGVSTIIGTLWPVETNAARLFFTAFYSHLKGTVTKGEAFHVAQEETRERLPQYRDWGAFYLIGAVV